MPVMNELLWCIFLVGFGASFGYALRDHIANKENKVFCDRLDEVLTDEDYRPLPMATYDTLARRSGD